MRFTRLIGALLAVVLMGGLGLVSASVATADDATTPQVSERATVSQRAGAREVTGKINKKRGKLYLVGKVKPRKGPVVIQRATKCGKNDCNFKLYKKVGTNKKGRYISRVVSRAGGDYFYRARVGTATSPIYRVFRIYT